MIGPDHFSKNQSKITYSLEDWTTNTKSLKNFLKIPEYFNDTFIEGAKTVKNDHSINSQISDVNNNFPKAEIVTLVIGSRVPFVELNSLNKYLKEICTDNCLIIASVDFSHFVNLAEMIKQDKRTIELLGKKTIKENSFNQNNSIEVDCPQCLFITQEYAKINNLEWRLYKETKSAKNDTTLETTSHVFGSYR